LLPLSEPHPLLTASPPPPSQLPAVQASRETVTGHEPTAARAEAAEPGQAQRAAAEQLLALRAQTPLPWLLRQLLLLLACISLATGIIGIFVPGLPTTVFVLLAAWAAARSSSRLYGWLLYHRLFGPMIINWHQGGFVSRRVKWSASISMLLCALIAYWLISQPWVQLLAIGSMLVVCIWLWLRPEPK
jgi:uncharacterized membrane protein YbaN (DUF454 family)